MSEALKQWQLDHKRIDDLFFQAEQSEVAEHKLSFSETALNEIAVLCTIESELVYPRLEASCPEISDQLDKCRRAHHVLCSTMHQLASIRSFDSEYEKKFKILEQLFKEHINIEEHQLFPHIGNLNFDDLVPSIRQKRAELLQRSGAVDRGFTPQTILYGADRNASKPA